MHRFAPLSEEEKQAKAAADSAGLVDQAKMEIGLMGSWEGIAR
jgi:hypothetical protein